MRSRVQMSGSDVNVKSGLCNAEPHTLSQMRAYAIATRLTGDRSVDSLLLQAEYLHQADENWQQALQLYDDLMVASYQMEDHRDMATPAQWRQVYMGTSRCCFELGMYDKCIAIGPCAVAMNRHFPMVHRYIALAQEAKSDYAEAVKSMKHAILYEASWCDLTIQSNKLLLRNHPFYRV
eukprot:CAMPEP_0201708358 /NCGR_PEP_ID=MMETSP0578-20130828/55275_1 /ASSEMBLY_ACC=CAM_ASM_000663 /TAXON_ID=267565 /ORGANISM="Skeletonema grethea, Strain CCMP 1804" /LENGTH=178 /DNA_ID=CAMNT_0048197165 /DNA_START=1 /DNA_END=537 /DNA_ORIENTATION=-